MGLNLHDALGVHPAALALRTERTQILASNLANESTPGYQARDIDFRESLRRAEGSPSLFAQAFDQGTSYRLPYGASRDGNTVELGVEQAAFAQNATDFQTSLAFLNMKLKGIAAAIQGGYGA